MVDFNFTLEQLAIQKKTREFAQKEILPIVNYFDEEDEMPVFILKRAFDAGIMNLGIPKQYGGKGCGLIEEALAVEEIAAADVGLSTSIFDNSLGEEPLINCANEEAKNKYLLLLAKNFKLIAFATSETMMGSDVAGMRCKAEKDGDDYILTGTKYWITNGGAADYYSVFATADPEAKHKGICAFLLEKGWKGITIGEHIPKMGLRLSNTVALKLDHVRVPKENILAGPGDGFKLAMKTFSRTRPIIGSFGVGGARSAMEFAMEYAKKRQAFEQKLAEFQSIQFRIAEMYQKVETARLLTLKAAWEADAGQDSTISASIAKMYSSEAMIEVVNSALQIFGGYGYTRMYPIEKIYRDIRVLPIYEGTSEVQRIVISRHAMTAYKPTMPLLEDLPSLRADDVKQAAREGLKDQIVWRCRICGYIHYGPEAPAECPVCRFPKGAFKKVWPKETPLPKK